MTIESFIGAPASGGRTVVRKDGEVKWVAFGRRIRYPTAPFGPAEDPAHIRASTPRAIARDDDAREHPPCVSHRQGALRLRSELGDAVYPRRSAPGHLQQLPSVLYREAEAARHAGAHRSLPEEVRECAGGAGEEEGGGAGEGGEEGAGQGEEGQGGEEG